jgi:signal transduction histidine kinase
MLKIFNAKLFLNVILLITVFSFSEVKASQPIVFNETDFLLKSITPVYIYEDITNKLTIYDITKIDSFIINEQPSPNLGLSNSTFWIKLNITNNSIYNNLILGCSYSILDEIELYTLENDSVSEKIVMGDKYSFSKRNYDHQYFMFDINVNQGKTKEYLLKIKSWEQIVLPLFIGTQKNIFESNIKHDLIFGLFFGIMFVLVFYNLFIYFTVKDSSYLYYIIYIFFITLTQAALNGYSFKFIFPNFPYLSNISLIIFNSIAGLATIKFIQTFLKTKIHLPKLNKGFYLIAFLYLLGIVTVILNLKQLSYKLMDLGGFLISFFSLFIAIKMSLKGDRSAKFFLLAWSFFLVGVILFVLKNSGILPSNSFTNYTMTIGIALEGILLSFALANKINIIQAEKKELIINQNIILEQRVEERTDELNKTLKNLKETQSQLVDAEKMSSLGQLTAGIAHEINNPINFVSSNIPPLKQDIDDLRAIIDKYEEIKDSSNVNEKLNEVNNLKQELDYEFLKTELNTIINGIDNGAKRTAEIVKGLKNFSRLDENDLMIANINEGIESTIAILKNTSFEIDILLNLNPLPEIECFPGKLNQVFLNVINNAIQAAKENTTRIGKGKVEITTLSESNVIKILISDNGIGMTDEIKAKVFEPFFTTKKVGDGTGLGLSIVYRIIENHNGKIDVNSIINKGTTFIITLPIKQLNK